MKLFLDTIIFPEFIDRRAQYDDVCLLIDAIHDGRFEAFVSTGCMYTLAFQDRGYIRLRRRPHQENLKAL